MRFIQLIESNKGHKTAYQINVESITGMKPVDNNVVIYVNLSHGGTGKGMALFVENTTVPLIFEQIKSAPEV